MTRCGWMLVCGAARLSLRPYGVGLPRTCNVNSSLHIQKYLPGLSWPIFGSFNGAFRKYLTDWMTRDMRGCLLRWLFLMSSSLEVNVSRHGKRGARSFAVRLSIWKSTKNLGRHFLQERTLQIELQLFGRYHWETRYCGIDCLLFCCLHRSNHASSGQREFR